VKSFLTVGRRPPREYNDQMLLSEAYERLDFVPPLQHERAVFKAAPEMLEVRQLGTSARMLLELYLDLDLALRCVGTSDLRRVRFLCVCLDPTHGKILRSWLEHIHTNLELDVDLDRVQMFPHNASDNLLRGHEWYSWAVFCDHAVHELKGGERNFGPYGFVRNIYKTDKGYLGHDREHNKVCRLTPKGLKPLLDQATCPIFFKESGAVPGVSFPAWQTDAMRLRITRQFST
jgi:hypothetical protein